METRILPRGSLETAILPPPPAKRLQSSSVRTYAVPSLAIGEALSRSEGASDEIMPNAVLLQLREDPSCV